MSRDLSPRAVERLLALGAPEALVRLREVLGERVS